MSPGEIIQTVGLVLLILAIGYTVVTLSFFVGNKDSLADIQKYMASIVGTSAVVIILTGIFTYIYIRMNPQAFIPIMLLIGFVSMEMSLAALGGSVLSKAS